MGAAGEAAIQPRPGSSACSPTTSGASRRPWPADTGDALRRNSMTRRLELLVGHGCLLEESEVALGYPVLVFTSRSVSILMSPPAWLMVGRRAKAAITTKATIAAKPRTT